MRKWLWAFVLVAVMASPAIAGPEEDALKVIEQWAAAFNASDVDAIVALYAPDAMFLGTGSRTVVLKTAEIRDYFERALLTDRPRGAVLESRSVMTLSDGAVVITGLDVTTATRDGKTISSPGRVTFVVAKRGGLENRPLPPIRRARPTQLRTRIAARRPARSMRTP